MTEQTMQEILARLDAQEQELVTLRSQCAARRRPKRSARVPRRRLAAALIVALLVASLPLSLVASDRFTDVPFTNGFHDDINAIAAVGITRGCNPPANDRYCPSDFVTREQMAAFLARTAGLGGNPPVANAAVLQGFPPNALTRVGGGADPTGYSLTTGYQPIGSALITAPTSGFLLVTGAASVASFSSFCPCMASFRLREVGTGVASLPLYATVGATSGSANTQSVTGTWIFGVGSGQRGVVLEARQESGIGLVTAGNSQVTTLFVPFGPTGARDMAPDEALPQGDGWIPSP